MKFLSRLGLLAVAIAPVALAQARLSLLEALENTLTLHPQLMIGEQSVEATRAVRRQALGQFDTVYQGNFSHSRQYDSLPNVLGRLDDRRSTALTAEGSVTRLLRNGITVEPLLQMNGSNDSLIGGALNAGRMAFQVTVPLLRGRGREAVESKLTAAGLSVDASLFDLNQLVSEMLAGTAASYWRYLAATQSLRVLREAEDRGKVYIENVQALIEADRVPRNEIYQVRANLSSRAANRIGGDQRLVESRQQLALAMGLSAAQLESIGEPGDAFPENELEPSREDAWYVNEAIARRADLLAARKREDSARVLREGAKNQIKPQVDFVFRTGYSGFREGTSAGSFLSAPFRGVSGVDAIAGINYRFPRSNNTALGQLAEAEAGLKIAEQSKVDLNRTVASTIIAALAGVRTAAAQLRETRRSVADFQAALNGEREKYRLGRGSLVDILTIEDRLTFAAVGQVEAQLAYAAALTRLRLATGSIVEPTQRVHTISSSIFLQLPFEDR